MKLRDLVEGVKVGAKAKNSVINRSDFGIGIEYEFRGYIKNDDGKFKLVTVDTMPAILKQHGISFKKVEKEHDFQVEVVTDVMGLSEGLQHIQKMFKLLSTKTDRIYFEIDELKSGLHISISLKDSKHTFNPLKFLLLMNTKYIGTLFPEREYTPDNNKMLKKMMVIQTIDEYDVKNDISELYRFEQNLIDDINGNNELAILDTETLKYNAIKLNDYALYNGRIELRFFGGKDYLNYPLIKDQVARALYLLDIAHGDKFHKEYIKILYKFFMEHAKKDNDNLLKKLQTGKIDGATLRQLHTEWLELNNNIENLEDDRSIIYYLKISKYVKEHLPNNYERLKHNFKKVIEILADVNGDLRTLIVWVPEIVEEFIDDIIDNKLHKTFNLSKLPNHPSTTNDDDTSNWDNLLSKNIKDDNVSENLDVISISSWGKILNIPNIENISISDFDDPLKLSIAERETINKLIMFNKKLPTKHIKEFLKEFAEIVLQGIDTYSKFETLSAWQQNVINKVYPGTMEDLMLKDLEM